MTPHERSLKAAATMERLYGKGTPNEPKDKESFFSQIARKAGKSPKRKAWAALPENRAKLSAWGKAGREKQLKAKQ